MSTITTRQRLRRFALALAMLLALAACGSGGGGDTADDGGEVQEGDDEAAAEGGNESAEGGDGGLIAVLLPDTESSARWEDFDRPAFEAAFEEAGLVADEDYIILNAEGDPSTQQTQADQALTQGASVIVLTNLDSGSGAAIHQTAKAEGVAVIDYDRLTLGGEADYYVSFDNTQVGRLQGETLVQCVEEAGIENPNFVMLRGSPDDNNATLFKQGYEKVVKDAGYTVAADQAVPDWDNQEAGRIFEQIYNKTKGEFVGVAAANDGLGGAVVSVLQRNNLAGKIPVTGQDATDEGLQRVLAGTQYVTVYKAIKKEAEAAAQLAIKIVQGDKAGADALATGKVQDTVAGKDVPSVLLEPQPIYKDTVKDVVADGFTTVEKICTTAELKKACADNGVS